MLGDCSGVEEQMKRIGLHVWMLPQEKTRSDGSRDTTVYSTVKMSHEM